MVSTNTVLGTSAGTETLINSHGDFYEQVTRVASSSIISTYSSGSIVSTNIVPGYSEGTEILTGTDGNLFAQVTRTPISTNTVSGSIVGTEILINSDGDFFEQVTSFPVFTIINATSSASASAGSISSTSVPSWTHVNDTFIVSATNDTSSSAVDPSIIFFRPSEEGETLSDTTGDAVEQESSTPVSTGSLLGSLFDTEILSKSNGVVSTPVPTAANVTLSATPPTDIIYVDPKTALLESTKEVKPFNDTSGSPFVYVTGTPVATRNNTGINAAIEMLTSPSRVDFEQATVFSHVSSTMASSTNGVDSVLVAPRPTTSLRNSVDEFNELSTSAFVLKKSVSGPTATSNTNNEVFEKETVSETTVTGTVPGTTPPVTTIFDMTSGSGRNAIGTKTSTGTKSDDTASGTLSVSQGASSSDGSARDTSGFAVSVSLGSSVGSGVSADSRSSSGSSGSPRPFVSPSTPDQVGVTGARSAQTSGRGKPTQANAGSRLTVGVAMVLPCLLALHNLY
ncbi:uncharacterized protein YALI1_A13200g [Yarrowia lipolytica]|uniref:Uncharacterized protein n=1 Tax=Yarrowia lipolytica TaxID=4952 RepID=A0A1D8N4L6_YARLL|nr:hypothetical protein YALI1_A13200g [Yarrowia lipolytica]